MAKVPNPLHSYRSYQYHFVLICSSDQEAVSNIDNDLDVSDLSRFMHPSGGPENKYNAKDINGTKYVIAYNSMVDVEFSIDSLTLEYNILGGGSGRSYEATNAEGEHNLKIEVIEPYTADFVTALHTIADSLGVVITDLKFGIKIIFVGYPDDHHTSSPHIVANVNIIPFQLTEISMSLTARGAHYDLECIPFFNNAANHHSASKIGGVSTTLPESLPDAVSKFEKEANDQAKKSQDSQPDSKPYKYKIILDDAYKDPKYKLDIVADDQRNTFNGSQPQTKNNTSSDKVPDFVDQSAGTTNAHNTDTTQNIQQNKDDSGRVKDTSVTPTNLTEIMYGEEKLRSFDKNAFNEYQKYRDNEFITGVQQGLNVDQASAQARAKATDKFSNEIKAAFDKSKAAK